ncbi:MAG: DUF1080 domain-containing protein [Planctomycetes bacterium]|nr:DUF1080 domain-containing protein [Planctomycetota bacterium]
MRRIVKGVGCCVAMLALCGCTQQTALFNGQNLEGWETYLEDPSVQPGQVWSVRDSVLHCKGTPTGYVRTIGHYSDYVLEVEWRWPEEPTNSGVLLHAIGEDKIWPQCIEAQLQHEHAGDFVAIQPGSTLTVNGVRYEPKGESIFTVVPKKNPSSEHPVGQWNHYKIVCKGDMIDLYVNGVHQNRAFNVWPRAGAICLQSEGSPIEFRNIVLKPLK